MREQARARLLPDGRRLLLQEGPIDLVIEAIGAPDAVRAAHAAAMSRFDGLLAELCGELPLLRSAVTACSARPEGSVARRMHAAVVPLAPEGFITPMAAVAGSVADAILAAMVTAAPLARAYVNNGGDIALHLAERERFRIGLVDRPDRPSLFGAATITADDPVRGVATSGYPGRSFSLGIAEAVTVLAASAAMADAAATVIANAVDLPGHAAVTRLPASELQPDSDLGQRPVTRAVAPLSPDEIDRALAGGVATALRLRAAGLIHGAALHLQDETRVAGAEALLAPPPDTPQGLKT